ncbi:MAG TPA: heat-inducible transcriptional repressor HrcA [Gemmatimonadales bacterium]|jgi:heat-inducible transcriptional repressor|nr:heat-inducible transcriptional repressor HrcA [Gemmatimonadales bacterium]
MPSGEQLTERELRVLEAVVQTYIETAEPAGSQTIARRFGLGVSPATIRNAMSELEEKGFLFHPHTSAGRVPTERAYRLYVDGLMRASLRPSRSDRQALASEIEGSRSTLDEILRRAAQVLGVLTQELGVAVSPAFHELVLERLELVPVSSERLLLVFNLRGGVVRTIFVQVSGVPIAAASVQRVAQLLNERLSGLRLGQVRESLVERLRDADVPPGHRELLNIFIAERDDIFDLARDGSAVVLGSAQMLAEQPEFSSNVAMRGLLHLTERRDLLRQALEARRQAGLSITIGGENLDPRLCDFTLVTSSYQAGDLKGVIGVMGPTRMPYEKIIGLVEHTSRLVEGLLE